MTVSIRKLSKVEAKEAFDKVDELDSKDLILSMALHIVQRRENLRNRTLVAHLKEWGAANLVRPQLNGASLDEAAIARALALLSVEVEMHKASGAQQSPQERAMWTRDRMHKLLAESAAATEDAKVALANRIAEAQAA